MKTVEERAHELCGLVDDNFKRFTDHLQAIAIAEVENIVRQLENDVVGNRHLERIKRLEADMHNMLHLFKQLKKEIKNEL